MFSYKKIDSKKFIRKCDVCGNETETSYISKAERCSSATCGIDSLKNEYIGKKLGDMTIIDIFKNLNQYIVKAKCDVCGLIFETRMNNFINNNFNNQFHSNCKKILYKEVDDVKKLKNFYERWRGMVRRCTDKNHKSYDCYSKIGISNEWMDFMNFYFDMYKEFEEEKQIDRIKDEKYSRDNCRWVTPEKNALNRSSTKKCISINLKTKEIKTFYKDCDISLRKYVEHVLKGSSTTVYDRLNGKVKNIKPYKDHMFFNTEKELKDYLSVEAK